MNLESLIDQQYELGHKDPHAFYELLERQLGEDLQNIVKPYIADFINEMARQRINNKRRASIAKITPKTTSSPQTLLHSLWVPDKGNTITYKRIADMTTDDFEARAQYLERMAAGIHRHAKWCRLQAEEQRTHNCNTAGELGYLVPLPDDEDL